MQSAASIAAPTRVAHPTQARYARCIEISKRVRWEIERDVIRDRRFDPRDSFLPVGLSLVDRLDFLGPADRRFVSQIQGRTYASMFSLVERYVTVKILDLARAHGVAEPVELEALVRFGDEEIKHQALFDRLEDLCAKAMPPGYAFVPGRRLKLVSSQVGQVAPSHRARWTHGSRLAAAIALTAEPALDVLIAPAVAFEDLPANLSAIFDPESDIVCQLIRYPAAGAAP